MLSLEPPFNFGQFWSILAAANNNLIPLGLNYYNLWMTLDGRFTTISLSRFLGPGNHKAS